MVKGSCVCGDWTYEYEGEPVAIAVCHCIPCRKTAGTNGSVNSLIPSDKFKQLTGTDRTFTRLGDSGKNLTYHNCATCGTIMWVEPEAMAGINIVKTGTIDDKEVLDNAKPVQEIYCSRRPASVKELEGIPHKDTA